MKRPTPAKSSPRLIPAQLKAHVFTKDSPRAKAMGTRGGKVTRVTHSKASRQ